MMTSQRKITANRSNARRSSGPRTAEGKRKASVNSRKHGWAALERHHPAASEEAQQLARAICGDEQDAALLDQARTIAENDLIRRAMRLQKLQTLELAVDEARLSEDESYERTIERLIAAIFTKFKDHLPPLASLQQCFSNAAIAAAIEELVGRQHVIALRKFVKSFFDKQTRKPPRADDYHALELATADVDRIERYETRAWSRQLRAMRNFIELTRRS